MKWTPYQTDLSKQIHVKERVTMASQDGVEKIVRYPAGDKKLDTREDSKSPS